MEFIIFNNHGTIIELIKFDADAGIVIRADL